MAPDPKAELDEIEPVDWSTLTMEEKVRRRRQIVAFRARGIGWDNIAETFGVDESYARRIFKEYRDTQPRLKDVDPVDVIEEMIIQYRAAAEELAMIAASTKQDSVKVGAIRERLRVMEQTTQLMQATGVLPNDLGTLRVEIDLRVMSERILRVFEEFGIGDDVQEAVIAAVSGRDPFQGIGQG
jgi:hypothetical protein